MSTSRPRKSGKKETAHSPEKKRLNYQTLRVAYWALGQAMAEYRRLEKAGRWPDEKLLIALAPLLDNISQHKARPGR